MKYAIIGCGRISKNHIASAKKLNLEISALCDIDSEKSYKLIQEFSLSHDIKVYTDYKIMIDYEKIDLISVATDSGSHYEIAKYCLLKNINLIIEKPITLKISHAQEIVDLAKERNLKVSACHQNRFNKSIQLVKHAIENNELGKIHYVTANVRWYRDKSYYSEAKWRGTWEKDGGVLMNQAIHNIDLLNWFIDSKIIDVKSTIKNFSHPYIEVEDFGVGIIEYDNGAVGIIEATTTTFPENLEETLYIFAEKGTIKIGGKSVNLLEEWRVADDSRDVEKLKLLHSERPENIYGFGHFELMRDVVEAIEYDREPYVTASDGMRALQLVSLIYNASKITRYN